MSRRSLLEFCIRHRLSAPIGMGSDDPKHRRSYAAPPSVVLGGIFVMGITMGIFLTLLAASAVPDKGARTQASRASRGPCTSRFHFLSISLSLSRCLAVTLSHDITPCTAAYHAICASGRATLRGILHTLRGTLYTCTLLAVAHVAFCETRAAARGAAPPRIGSHDVCMCACFCLCAWWAADPALETKPQLLLKSRAGSASPSRRGGLELRSDFWIETISDLPGPRIYVVSCTHAREPAGRCMRLFLHA